MTDTAPDKEKRKHGTLWYALGALVGYIVSYPLTIALLVWINGSGRNVPRWADAILRTIYTPMFYLVSVFQLEDLINEFALWVRSLFP